MKLRNLAISTALVVGTAVMMVGCTEWFTGTVDPNGVPVPAAGTAMTEQIWNDYMPELKPNMKFVYVSTTKKIDAAGKETEEDPIISTREVLKVEDGIATVKHTSGSSTDQATESVKLKFNPEAGEALKSLGAEDVTVEAGTYKNTAKFAGTMKSGLVTSDITVWLVSGIGWVKMETIAKMKDMDQADITEVTTQTLKSFSK